MTHQGDVKGPNLHIVPLVSRREKAERATRKLLRAVVKECRLQSKKKRA